MGGDIFFNSNWDVLGRRSIVQTSVWRHSAHLWVAGTISSDPGAIRRPWRKYLSVLPLTEATGTTISRHLPLTLIHPQRGLSLTERKQRGSGPSGLPAAPAAPVRETHREAIQASEDPCCQHCKQLPGSWGSAPHGPELCFLVGPQNTTP